MQQYLQTRVRQIMTKKRIMLIMIFLALTCFAAFLLVLAAPRIISGNAVKSRILAAVNRAPGVDLEVDKVALRWFAESRIEGLVFSNEAGFKTEIESIIQTKGLRSFAGRRIDFGEIIINRPEFTLARRETGSAGPVATPGEQPPEDSEQPAGGAPGAARTPPESGPAEYAGIRLPFDLKGSIKVRNASVRIVNEGRIESVLENMELDAVFKWLENPVALQFSATQDGGSINAALSIGGFPERTVVLDKIRSSLQLKLNGLQLGPVSRTAGAINRELPEVEGSLSADLRASTEGISKALLKVSIKGQDILVKTSGRFKPQPLDLVEITADLAADGGNMEIKTAKIESSAGRITAEGSLRDQGKEMPAGLIAARADIDIAMLAGIIPELLKVREDLEFTGGKLTAATVLDSDGTVMTVSGNADLNGLSGISAGNPGVLARPISAVFNAQVTDGNVVLKELRFDSSFAGIRAAGDMKALTASFSADIAVCMAELGQFLSIGRPDAAGQLNGTLSVDRLKDREAWQVALQVSGRGMAAAGAADRRLELGSLTSDASLVFHNDSASGRKGITDFRAGMKSDQLTVSIRLPGLDLPGGSRAYPEISACSISAELDLKNLAALLSGAGYLPEGAGMGGSLAVNAGASLKEGTAAVEVQASGKTVEFSSGIVRTVEPAVKLSLKAKHSLIEDRLVIEKLDIDSQTLSALLSGSITSVKTDKDCVMEGVFTCDYARLGSILSAATGKDIEMSGKREEKISISGRLGSSDKTVLFAGINGGAGIFLDKLRLFGMDMRDMDFRVSIGQGIAAAEVKTQFNEGKVELNPRLSAAGSVLTLTLPDESRVLQGVKLTDDMINEMIALMHPLLRNCAAAGGKIDMTISRCSIPLDKSMRKEMSLTGRLEMHDVVLAPEGLIKQLMDVARLEVRNVSLENDSVSFTVRDGRIETSPLKLGGGSSVITISGSVGIDGRLDYSADAPVTEKMVGADIFPYLKGSFIKIPIKGSASKPEINVAEFNQNLGNLVEDAGRKLIKEKGTQEIDKFLKEKGGRLLEGLLRKQ